MTRPKPVLPIKLALPGRHHDDGKPFTWKRARMPNDIGNGQRMLDIWKDYFRVVHLTGKREVLWMVWDGEVWVADQWGLVEHAARLMAENIWREAERCLPKKYDPEAEDPLAGLTPDEVDAVGQSKALKKWAFESASQAKLSAAVRRFSSAVEITVTDADFDTDTQWLNTPSGVVDLELVRTEGLSWEVLDKPNGFFMCRKQTGAEFIPDEKCPKWEAALLEIFGGSTEMVEYLQQVAGYAISGRPVHKRLWAMYGKHDTGKSFILDVLAAVFGTYAVNAASSVLLQHKADHMLNDVHQLIGARLVTTSETGRGQKLDLPLVKRLTGRDLMTTRDLYKSHVSWLPTFAIINASNEAMEFPSTDSATTRRVKALGLYVTFSEDGSSGHTANPNLAEEIKAEELPGVLSWVLEGMRKLAAAGKFEEPTEVMMASARYQWDADPVLRFMTQSLDTVEDVPTLQRVAVGSVPKSSYIGLGDLYSLFEFWCADEKLPPIGKHEFGKRLEAVGYTKVNSGGWRWAGLIRLGPAPGAGF